MSSSCSPPTYPYKKETHTPPRNGNHYYPGIKSRGGDGCHCSESPELLTQLDHSSAGGRRHLLLFRGSRAARQGQKQVTGTPDRCSRIKGRKQDTRRGILYRADLFLLPLELHPNFPNACYVAYKRTQSRIWEGRGMRESLNFRVLSHTGEGLTRKEISNQPR